jgi:hypothetical protein
MFKEFCQQIGTKVTFALVYPPQSNGGVDKANCLIFQAMKKIFEGEKKGKWAEVMPTAMWSHNTIVCRGTNVTPFLVNVWSRSYAARRNKAPKLAIHIRKYNMPQ